MHLELVGQQRPRAALWARYDDVLQSLQIGELKELDAWYLTSFPSFWDTRADALKKGKWRPQLMKFMMGLSEKEVKKASCKAFKELKIGDLRTATEALCVLKGVGPATASAVLAAYDESVPFMADEALEAIAGSIGPRKYTLPHFLSFAEALRAKARWLNEQRAANGDEIAGAIELWTAQRVQLCLYTEAHDGVSTSTIKKTKRKRCDDVTTLPLAEKKVGKVQEEDAKDQSLRRSQRKRQRPAS
ncbi:unnamed protein product [Peronospora destructor]|uniref:HhH-GPD domain-containing protein n=1 Tax=Peronospora destructor TaxID=86335 RepID=A0AAV0T4Y0_9STRA|nr:unnamed protein product [Peronospora destructor]